ncbi:MAG TPA: cyclic nucleotide-binding domain-containing protein [Deltaproteobacteria bacterium]|nr:cyclic nucleotide-binding domain-containing protein [Deltaproteobacteria bacterium]HOM29940.1 cyclic nucleotide-binding domain-containing protein [Deltaproteobacteria bacterium]HPP80421.1 cyclic nucleotide-binding domain-containing protein [Deltaproteobacteria bacterium]
MLDERTIESLEVREFKPGEIIVKEGDPSDRFFAILTGEVQISQLDKPIRILTERDVFGLENYYRGVPYTTTAKATRTSRIAAYESELIDEIAYEKPALAAMIMRSAFLQLEQTTSVAEANITYKDTINLDIREYKDGEVIIEEGTTGTEIFRLYQTEGGLEVLKKGVRIGLISKPGEYFGEMSFILNEPRSATIRSLGTSLVEVIPVAEGGIEGIISENPEIANRIITTLAARLREANLLLVK